MNTAPVITLEQIAHDRAMSAQPAAVYLASLAEGPGRVSTLSTLAWSPASSDRER